MGGGGGCAGERGWYMYLGVEEECSQKVAISELEPN